MHECGQIRAVREVAQPAEQFVGRRIVHDDGGAAEEFGIHDRTGDHLRWEVAPFAEAPAVRKLRGDMRVVAVGAILGDGDKRPNRAGRGIEQCVGLEVRRQ